MAKIGFIGVGKMGSRMATRLIQAGNCVTVCDKSATAVKNMIQKGAKQVEYPKDLCDRVQYIFLSIPTPSILKEIVAGENGLLNTLQKGQIIIDMSTIDPNSSADVNGLIEKKGGVFLRSSVTGSVAYAENGTLGIMVSGDRVAYEEVLPFLKIIGNRQRYLGDKEQSRFMKLCINMMLGTTMQMLAESLVLGEKAGINWEMIIECICDSAAAADIVKAKEIPLKKRDFTAMATSKMMEKDMHLCMQLANEYGLNLPLAAVSTQYYQAMRGNNLGDIDYSGLVLLNEKLCNLSDSVHI